MIEKEIRFTASKSSGEVSAVLMRPEKARWLLVFAHGAGAGIRHTFMGGMAYRLAMRGVASFRYQFPYMEAGKRAPNPQPILIKTVRSAVAAARDYGGNLPLIAGGKSLGGRMTSMAASQEALPGVQGIVFFGFPLHAPGKPSEERGEHLFKVRLPLLFLQGTRDQLADLALLRPMCDRLQVHVKAELHVVDGADHGFHVPKKSGRTDEDVLEELSDVITHWSVGLERNPFF
ncbi:MAG: alpha/beta hydrolase [Desulfatitalea sp. BRH_c12]|nr:MAG: alpha/beta hydrolase [Desulfatitalea sp. BRH_c12]